MKRTPGMDRKRGWRPSRTEHETLHAVDDAERRKPTEQDAPPAKPFPGRRINPTPGQLDVWGDEVK